MTYREKLNFVENVEIGERLELAKMLSDQLDRNECHKLADYIRGPLLGAEDPSFSIPVVPFEPVPVSRVDLAKDMAGRAAKHLKLAVADLFQMGSKKLRKGGIDARHGTPV